MEQNDMTIDQLKSVLAYEEASGLFHWKVNAGPCARNGDVAGTMTSGYAAIRVQYKRYLAHRLAWAFVHGSWPICEIDHIDGDKQNNRICNLRQATRSENEQNKKAARKDSFTGIKGVHKVANKNLYRVEICVEGRRKHVGYFGDKSKAGEAYIEAKRAFHPFAYA